MSKKTTKKAVKKAESLPKPKVKKVQSLATKRFIEFVEWYRGQLGNFQIDISNEIKRPKQWITTIKSGGNISTKDLILVMNRFGLNANFFFKEEEKSMFKVTNIIEQQTTPVTNGGNVEVDGPWMQYGNLDKLFKTLEKNGGRHCISTHGLHFFSDAEHLSVRPRQDNSE